MTSSLHLIWIEASKRNHCCEDNRKGLTSFAFLWILLSLMLALPCFPLVCHSYKQFLIATDREGSPICKECKQREQHGVLNKTSLPGLTNGRQYEFYSFSYHSISLPLSLMGWCMPDKWACPDWPGSSSSPSTGMTMLIISFCSVVNANNTIHTFLLNFSFFFFSF